MYSSTHYIAMKKHSQSEFITTIEFLTATSHSIQVQEYPFIVVDVLVEDHDDVTSNYKLL